MLSHRLFSLCLAACSLTSGAQAELRVARLFSEHAVLQAEKPLPIWGWATAGEDVTVELAGQTVKVKADAKGAWKATLAALKSGGPHTLTVSSASGKVTAGDILVGEVWLGSGQSNMAMTVSRSKDFAAEQKTANLPQIRHFNVQGNATATPAQDCQGQWVICTPETVGNFSATAYFFGREIHQVLKQPVGLINSSVGGTPIDSWIDASAQRSCKDLAPLLSKKPAVDLEAAKASYERQKLAWQAAAKEARAKKQAVPRAPRDPVATLKRKADIGGLFNGKIAPLIPYAVRGFLWYQGEANSVPEKAPFYQHHLPLLVQDWRKRWGNEQLPFAWVQLPNFIGRGDGWCLVREAMAKTLRLPNTGMAVTIDVGDPKDIHPKNKQEVGRRLSLWALGSVYGKAGATSGPRYVSHEILGPHVVIKMSHADGGLVTKGEKGFVICGEDRQWKPASVKLDGHKLFVSSTDVPKPVAVRYAWAEVPEVTLWNAAGLPASPFRTDDFPIPLEEKIMVRKAVVTEKP